MRVKNEQIRRWAAGILSLLLFLLFILPPKQEVLAASDVTFEEVVAQIEKLEQLAGDYVKETDGVDAKRLVMCYLISDRYSGGLWEKVAIRKDDGFEAYVKEKDENLAELKQMDTLTVLSGYEVDFLHMAASVYVGDDAGGWIGDLTEFAWELKTNGITDCEAAAERFLSADSYWNAADFHADIDAANMLDIYKKESFSGTLMQYYGTEVSTEEESLGYFIEKRFVAKTSEELRQAVWNSYKTHWLMQELLKAFEMDAAEDEVYLKLASDTVSDYLYEHAEAVQAAESDLARGQSDEDEDTEFLYWDEDTDGMVVTEISENRGESMLAGVALAVFIVLLLFFAYHNRKK